MNKFDNVPYIECKFLFIAFWLCYILRKIKIKEFILIWQQS